MRSDSLTDKSIYFTDEFFLSAFPNIDAPWSPMSLSMIQEMRNYKERRKEKTEYRADTTL